jgi:hypothetical protein
MTHCAVAPALVLNAQTLSPQEEMVEDLMTIVHCFSPTCGDMEALAVEQSATKLPWLNRKLDRRTHVRTN